MTPKTLFTFQTPFKNHHHEDHLIRTAQSLLFVQVKWLVNTYRFVSRSKCIFQV